MFIESIELLNYRNYQTLHMDFDPGTNVLCGDNAQGKTNILEAVYVCSTTKSHRGSRDRELVRFGEDEAHIKMIVRRDGVPVRIDMHLKKNKAKGIAVNGVPIRRASELFGAVNVIFFSPEDLNIIKNGPAERRRFVDLELCQLNRLYVHNLVQYNRTVAQRNRLLKEFDMHSSFPDMLDVWDEQLVRYGCEVVKLRGEFIGRLNEIIDGIHRNLSGNKERLQVRYEPNVDVSDFSGALKKNRGQELRQRLTLTGPHRDDLNFLVNGADIRRFGSQGQQRTAALSLKLAEIEFVRQTVKDEPILLLDDVLSELDSGRQEHLLSEITRIQTILTCTGLDELVDSRFRMDRVFRIVDGTMERIEKADPRADGGRFENKGGAS